MSPLSIHPNIVFAALSSKPARSERRHALKRIHEICGNHYQNGVTDISVSSVGKECESEGILKARALYNASSSDYKTLIDAWSLFSYSGKKPVDSENGSENNESGGGKGRDSFTSKIDDPILRASVVALIEERNALRIGLSCAEAEKLAREVEEEKRTALDATAATMPRGRPLKNVSEWVLKPGDLKALKKAISSDFMKSQGWRLDVKGQVLDSLGNTVYNAEYMQAIKKVLANAEANKKYQK
ncbi:MAG: gamma-mobile-trio protein GmtX [Pseudomonadota bacterium]